MFVTIHGTHLVTYTYYVRLKVKLNIIKLEGYDFYISIASTDIYRQYRSHIYTKGFFS